MGFFFHHRADLFILGPIRIAYAVLLLINILAWWPDLDTWFGENGVMTLAVSRVTIDPDTITIFQWLPTTSLILWSCYLLLIANTVCLMFGFLTRCQLVCVFVLFTSFAHRNNLIFDGEDILFRLMAFYLLLSPAGKYWSIDNWWASKKGAGIRETKRHAIWPLRLIQIQIVAVLFFSGCEKLHGKPWVDGTAIYYVSRLDDAFYRFPVPDFIFESLLWMSLLTWATVVFELAVPIAIWFSRTRRAALVLLFLFHISLDYSMNLNLFHWIMLVGWMSFIQREDIELVRNLLSRKSDSKLEQIAINSRESR